MSEQSANTRPHFLKSIQGVDVPSLGFGTFRLEGMTCQRSVTCALGLGYRHIDTARVYGNEEAVGDGIRESDVDRESIFLTSKVWRDDLRPAKLKEEAEASLRALGTDFLDLFLIHWPNPEIPLEDSIEAMEELRESGKIRHLGVSNFPPAWLERALRCGPVFCNQIEYHPLLAQDRVLDVARAHDVLVTAYSPLAQGEVIGYPDLDEIARRRGKTSEQVALRWLIEQDHVAAIPRSSKLEHIEANFKVFDFSLNEEEKAAIAALPKDRRQINPDFAPDWDA